jgi:hypothetical protein
VVIIDLVFHLSSGQHHFLGIDHDHEISGIHVGSKDGFILAPQDLRHIRRQPPEDLSFCIDEVPATIHFFLFCLIGFHRILPKNINLRHPLNDCQEFLHALTNYPNDTE